MTADLGAFDASHDSNLVTATHYAREDTSLTENSSSQRAIAFRLSDGRVRRTAPPVGLRLTDQLRYCYRTHRRPNRVFCGAGT